MSHREPLCWRRGTVPVPYVDALAARRSTSHRLSLASKKKELKKKTLRFLPPSPCWCFPLQLECKDLQPHRTAAPPTLLCTPTRSAKGCVRLHEMFGSSISCECLCALVTVKPRLHATSPTACFHCHSATWCRARFSLPQTFITLFCLNGSKIWWLDSSKPRCVCSKLFKVYQQLGAFLAIA